MSDFESLAKYNGLSLMMWDSGSYASENTQLASDFYKAGAQSRQSEVDELQKRIDEAIKEIQDESWSDEYGDNQAPTFKLIKILKGDQS